MAYEIAYFTSFQLPGIELKAVQPWYVAWLLGFGRYERLKERRAPVKAALLDQRTVAGLGNIYADEALVRAGIHPLRPAGRLTDADWARLREGIEAALAAGLPDTIPAFTVNMVCGSGLKSVALAAQAIQVGDAHSAIAGGMESMSQAP